MCGFLILIQQTAIDICIFGNKRFFLTIINLIGQGNEIVSSSQDQIKEDHFPVLLFVHFCYY